MGWLRLVGSLKLWVFFAEYSLFKRALMQKRPIILRSLLIVATPSCVLLLQKKTHKYVKETHKYVKETHTYVKETHTAMILRIAITKRNLS